VIFVVHGPTTVAEGRFPEAIRWLTSEATKLDHAVRVDSLANYPHPTTVDDELVVQSLLDWACKGNNCSKDLIGESRKSHLTNRLISQDALSSGVIVTVAIERGAVGKIEALYSAINELADHFESTFPGFKAYHTGGIPMMAAFAEASATDLGVLLPAAVGVISIVLVLVVGSLRLGLIILGLGIAAIVVTLGTAGWIGLTLNNATTVVPLIVLTLVVTSSMHVAVHFSRNIDLDSNLARSTSQAKASVSSSVVPVTLSALTSVASLSSLWFVDSPPIRELGLLSALGVAIGCVLTLTILPLLLTRVTKVTETRMIRAIQRALNHYARQIERGRPGAFVPTLIFVACGAGIVSLEINDDFVRFFDESTEFRIDTDQATQLLSGPNHVEIVLQNPKDSVFEPSFIEYLDKIGDRVRGLEIVSNVHSFSDVMEDVALAFGDQRLEDFNSPDEFAQLFLVYELSLQVGQSNTDLVNADQSSARASVLLNESTSSDIQALERTIYQWHEANDSPYTLIITGENIPVAHLSAMNIRSMLIGIACSLAFTALVLGLAFRSVRLCVVGLLATLVPVISGFGIWGWSVGEIGLAATAVIALTIGVVVDDAAHYIYRFIDARTRLGLDPWDAAAYSIHRVGAAIVSSSLVLGLGLSLLLLSNFEVNSSFGAVACLIISTALAFSILAMPRLTVWATPLTRMGGSLSIERNRR
jgi:uncharacterized protein